MSSTNPSPNTTLPPQRISFLTIDKLTLCGDYYPVSLPSAPIVILTQGLTLLKEFYIPSIALSFQTHNIASLIYDHRSYGSSSGIPRHETNLYQQAEDYHDAVTFALSLSPTIDPSRICIWGIGHSGGAAMIAAGDDPRIKCTILYMPMTSGKLDSLSMPPGSLASALTEREAIVTDPNHSRIYIPMWDTTLSQSRLPHSEAIDSSGHRVWAHGEAAYNFVTGGAESAKKAGTPWQPTITLQSLYHIARVEPEDFIHKIAPRKLLYISAKKDEFTGPLENHRRVFEQAGREGATFEVVGEGHVWNYFEGREAAINVMVEWLKENL